MIGRRVTAGAAGLAALAAVLAVSVTPSGAQGAVCDGLSATIIGTSGDDRIEGTPDRDVIVALEGRDVIFGRGGNDVICAGPGGDVIKGGTGNDKMIGGGGNDRLIGGIGKDTIDGGNGKDRIFAGGGVDTIKGGRLSDLVRGGNGTDSCNLDATDRFDECERGDVHAVSGVGSGTFTFQVPAPLAFAAWADGGGPALQTNLGRAFAGEIDTASTGGLSLSLGDAAGIAGQGGGGIEVDGDRQFVVTTAGGDTIDSVLIDGLGSGDSWEVTILGPDVLPVVPPDGIAAGTGSGVFALGAVQPGFLMDLGVDGNDEPTEVTLALLGPNSAPRVLLDTRFESPQPFLAFTGDVPAGGYTHVVVEAIGAVSLSDLVGFTATFTAL